MGCASGKAAECPTGTVFFRMLWGLEGEIGSVAVLTFDEAMRRLTYENARSVLRDAQEYLSYAGAI